MLSGADVSGRRSECAAFPSSPAAFVWESTIRSGASRSVQNPRGGLLDRRQSAAALLVSRPMPRHTTPGVHGDVPYSEDFQAALIQATWRAIKNCDEASGGVLWSWADYYHRRTFIQYAVFGPYGVVTVDRKPKAALEALTKMYGGRL